MNFCVKEKVDKLTKGLEKPVVRNRISWNMGVYKDEKSKEPEIELNVNNSREIKLYALVLTVAIIVFLACICHKVSKISNLLKS